MKTSSTRLLQALAAVTASLMIGSVALADGRGHGGGGPSFSGGGGGARSAPSGGGRSFSGGGGGTRSYSAPRGNFSAGGGRNYGGYTRTAPSSRPDFNAGTRGNFNSYSGGNRVYSGVRIPDATRPSYSPGSNPRPGFNTTRPDFGVNRDRPNFGRNTVVDGRSNFSTRPDRAVDAYRRPGARTDFSDRPPSARRPTFDNARSANFYRPPGISRPGFAPRPGFRGGFRGGTYYGPHWHGGYWNGVYWPRVYYRPNFVSFWPVLPIGYSTLYFGGLSYYYYDDVYYTWNPSRYGYVATDPPPAVESNDAVEEASTGSASVYVYPRNGQSEEQTSQDRYECHQWAVSQTGYDPTTTTPDTQASPTSDDDYRRAMLTCLDARGYSAK